MVKVVLSTLALTGLGALFEHYVIDPYIKPNLPDFSKEKNIEKPSTDPVVSQAEKLGFI
jgi:hypothetical protein